MFIELLSIFGTLLGFILVTLAIASGLFYLSELVEENTEMTNRLLKRTIKSLSVLLILLYLFDSFPFKLTVLTLVSYYVYYQNLKTFPYIKLDGPIFISSCILVVLNHYFWFRHFGNPKIPTIDERLQPDFKMPKFLSFAEIASFFGICIWFVPFCLFISLSANDNALPVNATDLHRINNTDISSPSKSSGGPDLNENVAKVGRKSVNLFKFLINSLISKIETTFKIFGINLKLQNHDYRNPNEFYS